MRHEPAMLHEAICDGRIGLHEMTGDELVSLARECYDAVEIKASWYTGAPFRTPVWMENDKLLGADAELICEWVDATPAERSYIVRAINAHEALVALLDSAALNEDAMAPGDRDLVAKASAAAGRS